MKAILMALALVGCALAMPVGEHDVPLVITDYSSVVESKNLVEKPAPTPLEPAPVVEESVESAPASAEAEAAADTPVVAQDPLVEAPLPELAELATKEEEIKPTLTESEEIKIEEPIPESSQSLEAIKDAVAESLPVLPEILTEAISTEMLTEAIPTAILPAAEEKPIAADASAEEIKVIEAPVEDSKVPETPMLEEIKVADAPIEEVKVVETPSEEIKVAEVIPEEVKVADAPVEEVKVIDVVVEEIKVEAPVADETSAAELIPTLVDDTPIEKPEESLPIEAAVEAIKEEAAPEIMPEADKPAAQLPEIIAQLDAKPEIAAVADVAESKPVEIPVVETVVELEPAVVADEKPEEVTEMFAVEKPIEEKPLEKPVEEAAASDEKFVELKPEETVAVETIEAKPEESAASDESVEAKPVEIAVVADQIVEAVKPEAEKIELADKSEETLVTEPEAKPLEETIITSTEALLPAAEAEKEEVVIRRRRGLEGKLDEIKKPTGANKKDDSYVKGEKKPKSEEIKVAVFEDAVPIADTPAVEEVVPVVVAVEKSHSEAASS